MIHSLPAGRLILGNRLHILNETGYKDDLLPFQMKWVLYVQLGMYHTQGDTGRIIADLNIHNKPAHTFSILLRTGTIDIKNYLYIMGDAISVLKNLGILE